MEGSISSRVGLGMRVHVTATGFNLTPKLEKYVGTKISQLSHKMPQEFRASAICEVRLTVKRKKGARPSTCRIRILVNNTELNAEETTPHIYSSLDIASVHVGHQLRDYVAKHRRRRLEVVLRYFFRHRY